MRLPRLYPILDTGLCNRRGLDPSAAARAIVEAGARILQLRHKGHFSRELFAQAEQIAALCRGAGVQFVMNDRADLAMLLDCGLHVGQDDLPPAMARKLIGPGRLLGFSTHNEAQLLAGAAEEVDYVAIGPVFGTASKLNPDPVVGVEELRRLRPLVSKPLAAIGGITTSNVREVIEAGADSVALIADLIPPGADAEQLLRARMTEWMAALELPR